MSDAGEIAVLSAELREEHGTGPARALRRAGRIPAVIYSRTKDPRHVSVDLIELRTIARSQSLLSGLIGIDIAGTQIRAIAKEIQRDPVRDNVLHLDFQELGQHEKIAVFVPVKFNGQGDCVGMKRGGVLNVVRHSIELLCPADDIPETLEVDLTQYDVGSSIHIDAITLPQNATSIIERNFTVATIVAPGGGIGSDADESTEVSEE